jgi:hypothetical protein
MFHVKHFAGRAPTLTAAPAVSYRAEGLRPRLQRGAEGNL